MENAGAEGAFVSPSPGPLPTGSEASPLLDDVLLARVGPTARRRSLYEQMQRRLMVLLPICAYCKRVRAGDAEPPPGAPPSTWGPVDSLLFAPGAETGFTHSVCPDCYESELVPQLEALKRRNRVAG